MKIGLQQPFFNFPGKDNEIGATLIAIAKTAESSGFSSFWLMDHFYQVGRASGVILIGCWKPTYLWVS